MTAVVEPAPSFAVAYSESMELIGNPERGWWRGVGGFDLTDVEWSDKLTEPHYRVVHRYVRLDTWRNGTALPQSLLDDLTDNWQGARDQGVKIVPRFTYNFGPIGQPDASKATILSHIAQLAPVVAAGADVIAVLEAGFVGTWGEWHDSTNSLDNSTDLGDIASALLDDVMPADRMIAIRYPFRKCGAMGDNYSNLTRPEAYSGSHRARSGMHFDCFLADSNDAGTFQAFGWTDTSGRSITQWRDWCEVETLHTCMIGETCSYNPGTSRESATLADLAKFRWSTINRDFETAMIDYWIAQGWYDEITRRLGYRFVLTDAQIPTTVRPGGNFRLRVRIKNVGWAGLFNPRPVYVVVEAGATRHEAQLTAIDPRWWKGGDTTVLEAQVEIPASLAEGSYTLALWMPDAYASIKANPAYAIRCANDGVWNAAKGYNTLGTVVVSNSAPGDANAAASALTATTLPVAGAGGGY